MWGEGPRGGIFGARVDPGLYDEKVAREFADREAQALAQMQAEQPSIADRIGEWWASLNTGERKRYLKKAGK